MYCNIQNLLRIVGNLWATKSILKIVPAIRRPTEKMVEPDRNKIKPLAGGRGGELCFGSRGVGVGYVMGLTMMNIDPSLRNLRNPFSYDVNILVGRTKLKHCGFQYRAEHM